MNEDFINNAKKLNNILREMNDDWADSAPDCDAAVFRISYLGRDAFIPIDCLTLNAVQHLCDEVNRDVRCGICNDLYDLSEGVLLPSYTNGLLEDCKALALVLWLKEVEEHGEEERAGRAAGLRHAIETIGAAD